MNKKPFIYLSIFFISFLIISCQDDDLGLENVGLDDLITDQEGGFVSITSSAASVFEGDSITVTVGVPNPVGSDVNVGFSLSGDADFGTDYGIISSDDVTATSGSGSGTVVFDINAGGSDDFSFIIYFLNDAIVETGESVVLTLISATADNGVTVDLGDPTSNPGGDPVISTTITISDPSLSVGFANSSFLVTESLDEDTLNIPIIFSTGNIPGGTATISYLLSSSNGMTIEGVDYNILDGTSPINDVSDTTLISIEFLPDQAVDGDTLLFVITAVEASTGLTITVGDADSLEVYLIDNLSFISFQTDSLVLSSPVSQVAITYLFDISLSTPADADVLVEYSLSSAISGISLIDGGSLTIESGDLTGAAVVSIDPSVFDDDADLVTSLMIDDVTSASDEVSLSSVSDDLSRSITIDNTP